MIEGARRTLTTLIAKSPCLSDDFLTLIVVGAVSGFLGTNIDGFADLMLGPFTALPMIVYSWSAAFKLEFTQVLAPAAIIVLLAFLLLMNLLAVLLRTRFERRW